MLFIRKTFVGAGGIQLNWKIECDVLTKEDWLTLAMIAKERFTLTPRKWIAVPTGGLNLAIALEAIVGHNDHAPILVDDVLTTGSTIAKMRSQLGYNYPALVAFDRRSLDSSGRPTIHVESVSAIWRFG